MSGVLSFETNFDAAFNQAWRKESSVANHQRGITGMLHWLAFNIAW
jgi:hypothetical protein